ncbi:hypothetical protein C437_04980 [Haloarcula vallismortis ATCC 29715]|uniref:Uncharacterized protein n=1 Tax=Haloarcula vallismortis ATCC 29715 TaxID=662477 RepID=M0JQ70_HALVA|nr:hypothetical protein C437_04980 [Haloarcula vallismortis ATCC 29715]
MNHVVVFHTTQITNSIGEDLIAEELYPRRLFDQSVPVLISDHPLFDIVRNSQDGDLVAHRSLIAAQGMYVIWRTTDGFRKDILRDPEYVHLFRPIITGRRV